MTGTRERLPSRRPAEMFDVECGGTLFTASVGRFDDGRPAEIFLRADKADSALDTMAKDSAVLCSLLFQFGAPLDVVRRALLRDPRGVASSPLGEALERLQDMQDDRRNDDGPTARQEN